MDKMPVAALLFQGFPESLALVVFGFTVFNIRAKPGTAIFVTVLQIITAYFARLLPFKFGIHSIILIFTLAFYINLLCRVNIFKAVAVSLTSFLLFTIVESITVWVLIEKLNYTYEALFNTTFNRVKFGLVSPSIVLATTGIFAAVKRSLFPGNVGF